jgi:cupin superfamily acireductone dioxygenase involved in methionine salvage
MKSEEKDRRSKIYLLIIIIVLFLINGALIYNLINKEHKITLTETKLEDTSAERDKLQMELNETEVELLDFKGKNASLDSIIGIRDSELENKVNQIKALLANRNLTKSDLDKARQEIASLRMIVAKYKTEIDSLSKLNQFLEDQNYAMSQAIEEADVKNTELTKQNIEKDEQIRVASQMKAINLVVDPLKVKWNEKERPTSKLASVDKIKVTFNLDKNAVAKHTTKTVFLKIITPTKATLNDEAKGSGTFKFLGEESLYSMKKDIEFANKNEAVSFIWDKSASLIKGEYEVLLFCEDFIIGTGKFSLK